jgi:plastocyanin
VPSPRWPMNISALGWVAALVVSSATSAAEFSLKIVDQKNAPAPDAVVALYPLDAPAPSSPAVTVEIEQRDKQFHPFVTALRAGSSARLPNNEKKIEHQVYSSSPAQKFEFPLYKPGRTETVAFDQTGIVVLGCNIHDSMVAYVVVLDTPWFATSDATGRATIRNLPPGHYRTEVWHPQLKDALKSELAASIKREIAVADSPASPPLSPLTLPVELKRASTLGPISSGGHYR